MSVTITGLFLIPLGVVAFLARPKWLYALAIFFAPFSATSLINSGSGDAGSGFQPGMYFGGLLLLRAAIGVLFRMRVTIPRPIRKPLWLVFVFVAVCGASLMMPFIINGRILVMTHGLLTSPVEPLYFKSANITYEIGVIYGLCFAAYVARESLDPEGFMRTVRIYLASGIFISLWGIMQGALFIVHLPYPAAVFNNSASPYALGYEKELSTIAVPRVSSVALEASVLATCIVGMLPIVIAAIMGRRRIFGKFIDWTMLVLMLVTLALTTSSTAYLSAGVLALVMAWTLYRYGRLNVLWILGLATLAGLVVAAAVVIPQARVIVQEVLLNKSDSYSALERGTVVLRDAEYFQQYPILGLGWGSAPAHDLTFGLLANTGVIGLSSFVLFIGYMLWRLRKDSASHYESRQPFRPSYVMFLSILATCSAYVLAGLPGGPAFWLIVGLGVAACGQVQPAVKPRKAEKHGLRWLFRTAVQAESSRLRRPLAN